MATALKDYAMIGDCRTAALISTSGSLDWLCLPDFSSPSIFAAILDEKQGGSFSITLENIIEKSRRYLPDTAVLETTITNAQGSIRLTDCMPVTPDARHSGSLQPLREILRRVEVLSGNPTIITQLDARPRYAKTRGRFRQRGKLGWSLSCRHNLLNLITDFPLALEDTVLKGSLPARDGDRFWFSLTFENGTPRVLVPIGDEASGRLEETADWWRQWSGACSYSGIWREQVVRSAITLRMLIFTQSGAVVAAPTTSLPERPKGHMNWDYRYCWPRDSSVTLSAFMRIGLKEEAGAFFDWLMLATGTTRPHISNMYDVYGRSHINEKLLPWLAGYDNARPVRIGNVVTRQVQHDVYGEVMMAVENWVRYNGRLESAEHSLIEGFGKVMAGVWREPDNGIWEIRGEKKHYTYSKVMAWYVFDSLIRLHDQGFIDGPLDLYHRERSALHDMIEREAFDARRNCYTAFFGSRDVDASLLLLPRCGFVAYDDPRMQETWNAIVGDLERNGIILRYPPGFGGSEPGEGAFIICNFWAVNYLTGCGRLDEARARLERLMELANDVGLYNEGVNVETREALGNMPQAYSHAGLITSIMRLSERTTSERMTT